MIDAVVAGHICLDIIPSLPGPIRFEPGRLIEAGTATLSTGGTVSNTGLALNRLGMQVQLIGKVGDDLFGDNVKSLLNDRRSRLGDSMAVAAGEATSYTIVVNLSGVDRMFLHAPGCNNTFVAEDVPIEALQNCRLLHFGYPPLMARMFADEGTELLELMKKAKAAGATTSLDMSLPDPNSASGKAPWRRILERVLPYVDVFLPSYDELLYMVDPGANASRWPAELLAEEALRLGAKAVGLKLGDQGLLLLVADHLDGFGRAKPDDCWAGVRVHQLCFDVHVAGTTGAGDATIAGFLMGLLRGFTPEKAVEAGVAVGACCCETSDSTSGIRSWPETEARLLTGWACRVDDPVSPRG